VVKTPSMSKGVCLLRCILVAAVLVIGVHGSSGQVRHVSGQNVAPVFEGWERNPDGSFNLLFGYMNRNYEEQPEIPIGPDNNLAPGGPDRGQPTHFYPRRQQFMFKVQVPKDFGSSKELVWALTRNGQTAKAYGTLKDDEELTPVIISQNRGGLASDEETAAPNKPPTVTIDGPARWTISLGDTLTLAASVRDDGVPKPRPPGPMAGNRADRPPRQLFDGPGSQAIVKPNRQDLAVTWVNYRGSGRITFQPMSALVKGDKVTTKASFSQPGAYTIRAYADDGVLTGSADVTVTVNGVEASQHRP
jgi:hypothetical protein